MLWQGSVLQTDRLFAFSLNSTVIQYIHAWVITVTVISVFAVSICILWILFTVRFLYKVFLIIWIICLSVRSCTVLKCYFIAEAWKLFGSRFRLQSSVIQLFWLSWHRHLGKKGDVPGVTGESSPPFEGASLSPYELTEHRDPRCSDLCYVHHIHSRSPGVLSDTFKIIPSSLWNCLLPPSTLKVFPPDETLVADYSAWNTSTYSVSQIYLYKTLLDK